MSLHILIALLAILFFGLLTISSSIHERKLKRRLVLLEAAEKRRLFEDKLLSEVQEALDHTLYIKKILPILKAQLRHLFTYTTVSTLVILDHALEFTLDARENV